MSGFRDDTTKPSRLNRRRKKRWKITDLIESGLTDCACIAMLSASINRSAGRGNPESIGVKTPQPIAAFLCLVIMLWRVVWAVLATGRPNTRYFHPTQPVAQAVESLVGGYSSLVLESPL